MNRDDIRTAFTMPPAFFENPTRAVISHDVEHMSDGAYFTLPGFTDAGEFGPARWQARDETSKPIKGNDCLVIMDSQGDFWITAWWPYGEIG